MEPNPPINDLATSSIAPHDGKAFPDRLGVFRYRPSRISKGDRRADNEMCISHFRPSREWCQILPRSSLHLRRSISRKIKAKLIDMIRNFRWAQCIGEFVGLNARRGMLTWNSMRRRQFLRRTFSAVPHRFQSAYRHPIVTDDGRQSGAPPSAA
jgi:hypothetical protein